MPLTDKQKKIIINFLHYVAPCHFQECFKNFANLFAISPDLHYSEFYQILPYLPLNLNEDTVAQVAKIAGLQRKLPQYKWIIGDDLTDKQLKKMYTKIAKLCVKFSIISGSKGDIINNNFVSGWCDGFERSYSRERSFDPNRRNKIFIHSIVRLLST